MKHPNPRDPNYDGPRPPENPDAYIELIHLRRPLGDGTYELIPVALEWTGDGWHQLTDPDDPKYGND